MDIVRLTKNREKRRRLDGGLVPDERGFVSGIGEIIVVSEGTSSRCTQGIV